MGRGQAGGIKGLFGFRRRNRVPSPRHKQVIVFSPTSHEIEVDEGMAPLLSELWRRGAKTRYSCQGGTEKDGSLIKPYIQVVGAESGLKTLAILLAATDGDESHTSLRSIETTYPGDGKILDDDKDWTVSCSCDYKEIHNPACD